MAQATMQLPPEQQNMLARSLVVSQAVERLQVIYSGTVDAQQQNVVNINPRNVGLLKGFFVDVEATITNGVDESALSNFGPANILEQIKFDDLQNNTRIQTTGWHVHMINSMRNARPFGLAATLETSPISYGNNWDVISAPATVDANADVTVKMRYYVPLAYSNSDLRGAIFANVVNATMQLQLTINRGACVLSTNNAQKTGSVYIGSAGVVKNTKITVYQHYLDQLPMGPQGPILPMQDLSTIYELKNTAVTGMTVSQDYTIQYSNFRTFLSTIAVFDNGGTLSAGTDVNYWALRSANFTDLFKMSPDESALLTRLQLGIDLPDGAYYFSHRDRPINTIQYGNMELVLNAKTVNSNARCFMGYEDFAMINVVSGAGSLPAGG